jgi:hypothetical protein
VSKSKVKSKFQQRIAAVFNPKAPTVNAVAAPVSQLLSMADEGVEGFVDVYRMEVETGLDYRPTVGPFCAEVHLADRPGLREATWKYKHELRHFPEPHEDGIRIKGSVGSYGFVCGFIDSYGFDTWMPRRWTWKALVAVGFKLNHYRIPASAVYRGHTQVVFHPKDAEFVESLEYETLHGLLDARWAMNELRGKQHAVNATGRI